MKGGEILLNLGKLRIFICLLVCSQTFCYKIDSQKGNSPD